VQCRIVNYIGKRIDSELNLIISLLDLPESKNWIVNMDPFILSQRNRLLHDHTVLHTTRKRTVLLQYLFENLKYGYSLDEAQDQGMHCEN